MLDLNDAYAIAKFIKDAEKQTPVKVYVSTTAEIAKAESFKVFGNNGEYTLIGDYKTIMDAIAPIKDQITDMYVENSARNSAIPSHLRQVREQDDEVRRRVHGRDLQGR